MNLVCAFILLLRTFLIASYPQFSGFTQVMQTVFSHGFFFLVSMAFSSGFCGIPNTPSIIISIYGIIVLGKNRKNKTIPRDSLCVQIQFVV